MLQMPVESHQKSNLKLFLQVKLLRQYQLMTNNFSFLKILVAPLEMT